MLMFFFEIRDESYGNQGQKRYSEAFKLKVMEELRDGTPLSVSNCIFFNTKNCLVFASAEGDDSERKREVGRGNSWEFRVRS